MEPVPKTMRALVAPKYCHPDGYEVRELPVPEIKAPGEVLIRVRAVGLFFGDATHAAGSTKRIFSTSFPIILGRMGSGVVAAVGSGVRSVRPGDAVYGVGLKRPMPKYFSDGSRGWAAEYAVTTEDLLLVKPAHVSWEEAAVLPANVVTAIQISRGSMALSPGVFGTGPDRSLEGKTVLVTAGLGASTSAAAQYAKNVLGASEVITTVSTAKIPLLDKYLPGVYNKAVDYQTQDLVKEIGKDRVDLLYCSRPDMWNYLPVMKRGGVVAAIVAIPSSRVFGSVMGEGVLPFWMRWGFDLFQYWYRWKLWGTGVQMKFVSGDLGAREDLEMAGEIVATGKVRGVYTVASLDDLDAIKKGCEEAKALKGRVGSLVVKIV